MGIKFDEKVDILDYIVGYTKLDFVKFKTNQKSTRDYIFIYIVVAISYLLKLQLIVVLSTYKAKYIIICKARNKLI